MTATIRKYHLLRKEVIKQLYYGKMLTLTELSSLSNKSLPLITNAVNDLVKDGYVLEHGLAPSSGGRRPLTFSLNPQKQMYIIAVAMDQLVTRMVIYDLLNRPQNLTYTLSLSLAEDADALTKLIQFIRSNIKLSGISSDQF